MSSIACQIFCRMSFRIILAKGGGAVGRGRKGLVNNSTLTLDPRLNSCCQRWWGKMRMSSRCESWIKFCVNVQWGKCGFTFKVCAINLYLWLCNYWLLNINEILWIALGSSYSSSPILTLPTRKGLGTKLHGTYFSRSLSAYCCLLCVSCLAFLVDSKTYPQNCLSRYEA